MDYNTLVTKYPQLANYMEKELVEILKKSVFMLQLTTEFFKDGDEVSKEYAQFQLTCTEVTHYQVECFDEWEIVNKVFSQEKLLRFVKQIDLGSITNKYTGFVQSNGKFKKVAWLSNDELEEDPYGCANIRTVLVNVFSLKPA